MYEVSNNNSFNIIIIICIILFVIILVISSFVVYYKKIKVFDKLNKYKRICIFNAVLCLILLMTGTFIGWYRNNDFTIQNFIFDHTYSLSTMYGDGTIKCESYWVSEKQTHLLVFRGNEEKDLYNNIIGYEIYESGEKKNFSCTINGKVLTIVYNNPLSGYTKEYTYSDTRSEDTWYCDNHNSSLRIGLNVYASIDKDDYISRQDTKSIRGIPIPE